MPPRPLIDLDDYVELYPKQDNPLFNSYIARTKEFSELVPPLRERGIPGVPFVHQEFAKRFIFRFDRMLAFHQAGTGKTRLIIHSREYLKESGDERRAFILTSGGLLKQTFYDEVIKFAGEKYSTPEILSRPTEKSRNRALKKEIRKSYTIESYSDFANRVRGLSSRSLDGFMSNTIVYVDEAQGTSTLEARRGKNSGALVGNEEERKRIYSSLLRAFASPGAKKSKVILLTATPMINEARDFSTLMDLILPVGDRIPADLDWEKATFCDVEPYLRGRISFIRRQLSGAIPVFKGELVETGEDSIRIWKSPMSDLQYDVYSRIERANFEVSRLQASNFVFPDPRDPNRGSFSPGLYQFYVSKGCPDAGGGNRLSRAGIPSTNRNPREFAEALTTRLGEFSEKFKQILQIVSDKYYDSSTGGRVPDNKGICFIFSEYVSVGADILALVLQYNGYSPFVETSGSVMRAGNRLFPKRKRFALITGSTPEEVSTAALKVANSPENMFGEYLQVIIGSGVTGKGISINNAVSVIFVTPQWNRTREEQARDRIFRSLSFEDRLDYKRGLGEVAEIEVEIYRMASVYETQGGEEESIDLNLYALAQRKSRDIARVVRFSKVDAVDAIMNKGRNIQPQDRDFSEICNYERCDYSPYLPRYEDIRPDYAGKLKRYMHEEKIQVEKELQIAFGDEGHSEISLEDFMLRPRMKEMDPKYVINSLADITSGGRARIKSRFGESIAIRERSDMLFAVGDPFDLAPSRYGARYSSSLTRGSNYQLYNILEDFELPGEQAEKIRAERELQRLCNAQCDRPAIEGLLRSLEVKLEIQLFEEHFSGWFQKTVGEGIEEPTPLEEVFRDIYSRYVYNFEEPVDKIKRNINIAQQSRRGKKPSSMSSVPVADTPGGSPFAIMELQAELHPGRIFVHDMTPVRSRRHAVTSYATAGGYLRVFKPREGVWRFTNSVESKVYKDEISSLRRSMIRDMDERFEQMGFYIISLPGRASIIRYKIGNKWMTGKGCASFSKQEVISFIRRMTHSEREANEEETTIDLCDELMKHAREREAVLTGEVPEDMRRRTENAGRLLLASRPEINEEPQQPMSIEEAQDQIDEIDVFENF